MLFVQEQYQYLVKNLFQQENYVVHQFDNQELMVTLTSTVTDRKCLVIGSLTASTNQSLSLLLLLDTLVQEGAQQVVLYSPYLGYQRQDCYKSGQSRGLLWADAMVSAIEIQGIVTIEPHNVNILHQLQTPTVAQSVEAIFDVDMANFILEGFTFVFPDYGSVLRSSWIQDTFPCVPYGFFTKKREREFVLLSDFQGTISRKIILYDDILDSGQTLLQACIALKQMHVQEIVIFVTHAFFYTNIWNDLWNLGVQLLFCTNSTPQAAQIDHPRIHVKSIIPLLQKYL